MNLPAQLVGEAAAWALTTANPAVMLRTGPRAVTAPADGPMTVPMIGLASGLATGLAKGLAIIPGAALRNALTVAPAVPVKDRRGNLVARAASDPPGNGGMIAVRTGARLQRPEAAAANRRTGRTRA